MSIDFRGVAPLLQVFDMPAAVHFYRDVLGFEIVDQLRPTVPGDDRFDWALLRFAGRELMLIPLMKKTNVLRNRTRRGSRRTTTPAFILAAKIWMVRTNICGRMAST